MEPLDFSPSEKHRSIPDTFPSWSPTDVVQWLKRTDIHFPANTVDRYIALITDPRMRGVWDWHTRAVGNEGFRFCFYVDSCCALPGFPGNLSAVERNKYF